MSALGWETHHRLWALGIGVVVLLLAAAAAVWFFVLRSTGTPFDLRQALRSYRDDPGRGAAGAAPSGLPPGGVYRYRTAGGESLSLAGTARTFPDVTEMVVRAAQRCAAVTWEPIVQHVEQMSLCRTDSGSLVMSSASTVETIAGVTTTQVITCPASAAVVPPDGGSDGGSAGGPGRGTATEHWQAACTTSGRPVGLTGSVVGQTSVSVDGRSVPATHTRVTLDFRGPATGPSPVDYWVADDGLLLKERESVDVRQPAGPLGSVTYHEGVTLTLTSLTPAR